MFVFCDAERSDSCCFGSPGRLAPGSTGHTSAAAWEGHERRCYSRVHQRICGRGTCIRGEATMEDESLMLRLFRCSRKFRRRVRLQTELAHSYLRRSGTAKVGPANSLRLHSFELFGPRAIGDISAAVFALLKQEPRPRRPRPRRWAESIKRDYGHDPLLDKTGNRMTWTRRMAPQIASPNGWHTPRLSSATQPDTFLQKRAKSFVIR